MRWRNSRRRTASGIRILTETVTSPTLYCADSGRSEALSGREMVSVGTHRPRPPHGHADGVRAVPEPDLQIRSGRCRSFDRRQLPRQRAGRRSLCARLRFEARRCAAETRRRAASTRSKRRRLRRAARPITGRRSSLRKCCRFVRSLAASLERRCRSGPRFEVLFRRW